MGEMGKPERQAVWHATLSVYLEDEDGIKYQLGQLSGIDNMVKDATKMAKMIKKVIEEKEKRKYEDWYKRVGGTDDD